MGNRAVGYTPVSGGRGRRTGLVIGLSVLAVVVVGLIVGAFFLGRGTAPDASNGGGDLTLQDGVPVPNRHTVAGAANAAANYLVAQYRVAAGTADSEKTSAVLLAGNASDAAKHALRKPTQSDAALSELRQNFAPASMVVQSYNANAATVLVWGSSTWSTREVPDPAGSVQWSSTIVTLAWDGGQWRVLDQKTSDGPVPAKGDERFAKSSGDFSFRYNEQRGGAWAYVPEG